MYLDWTKHLDDPEEKKRFEAQIESASPVLDRLKDLITEKIGEIDRSMNTMKQYDHPNWNVITAHKNGMAASYNAVRELVTV